MKRAVSFYELHLTSYHHKAAHDYETLKSGLGEYIHKVEQQRSKRVKTITGEFLRSVQEVQIANFLYLNGEQGLYCNAEESSV